MGIGMTSGIEKEMKCTAAVATQYLLAKFGADDDTLAQASASTDAPAGVFQHTTSAAGERIRTMLTGISKVKLGGTVARGDLLTSDANGKAIKANPGAGVNANYWGEAMASGVADDLIGMLLAPGSIQGA